MGPTREKAAKEAGMATQFLNRLSSCSLLRDRYGCREAVIAREMQ